MNPQSQMLAVSISKSLNLSPEWTVVDVEMRDCDPDPDELHVYVELTPGRTLKRPKCGAMHGAARAACSRLKTCYEKLVNGSA